MKAAKDLDEIESNWKTRAEVLRLLRPTSDAHLPDLDRFEGGDEKDKETLSRMFAMEKDNNDAFNKHA